MLCNWDGCEENVDENITAHINAHIESQKTYACMWKGCKRFNEKQSNKYTLQAHVRKHTNERPYQCSKCSKQYTRSDALNKHIKNHQKVEEETEELIAQLNIMQLRKRIATASVEFESERRIRIMQDIQTATQKLYENVYARVNNNIIKLNEKGESCWTKYLNQVEKQNE